MDIFEIEDPNEVVLSEKSGIPQPINTTCSNPLDMAVAELEMRQYRDSIIPPPAFLEGLNPEQRQAVEKTEGPLLVLSGAGTGKTKVLTTRIAYIIHQQKARPWQILAVTFTNKASAEMKSRLEKMIGGDAFSVWLGTFHAIGIKILRKYGEQIGLQSNFIVLNSDDQERLLKQLMQEVGIDIKKYAPTTLLEIIQRWKDKGLLPHQITARENSSWCNGMALQFYTKYQQRLQNLNAVDFGDLLLLPLALFQAHPDILAHYQQQFHYILVDEYQDTNVAQYMLLRLFAKGHHNICCVGDDDQSIYSWRGAEVENILTFQTVFPEAKIIRLERNYRSTGHILGAASGLIAHNSGRLGKNLKPADEQNKQGEKVRVKGFWNGMQEAEKIVEMIENSQRKGVPLSEMAILVRATFQTRLFEEILMRYGVPYKIIGGFKFYEREEIKDAIAYLRLILNPHDDLAFMRIINKPKRGIGTQAMDVLSATAQEKKLSLFDAIGWAPLRPQVRKTLEAFMNLIKKEQEKIQTHNPSEIARSILEECGYIQMWRSDKSPEAEGRIENIMELYTVLDDFETIQSFIEYATLVTDSDEATTDEQLIVMTLHASKGLEFSEIYLPGWEEGLFPHQKALDETGDAGLEEERRLAYVGITRAKRKVTISFANNRRMYGKWINSLPCRFIQELPEKHIISDIPQNKPTYGYDAPQPCWNSASFNETFKKPFVRTTSNEPENKFEKSILDSGKWGRENKDSYFDITREPIKKVQFKTTETNKRIGKRVRHEIFGNGTVIHVEGERLDVRFDSGKVKKIMARFLEEIA